MLSKQRVAAVHAEDFVTSLVGCTLRLRALFPSLLFLSRVFPRVARAVRVFATLPSSRPAANPPPRFSAAIVRKCSRYATEMHRQVGVAGIRFETREYYACRGADREKDPVGRNFPKIQNDPRDRASPGRLFLSPDLFIRAIFHGYSPRWFLSLLLESLSLHNSVTRSDHRSASCELTRISRRLHENNKQNVGMISHA